jgi:PPOX class probable F420-dependent enzyme
MAIITPAARAFIETGPFGHIVTLNPDGTPHVSLAWVGVDGDELVWSTFSDQRKIANLRRDPRISVSFQAKEPDGGFLYPYLVAQGTATITEGGALDVMDRLSPAYIGADQFPNRNVPAGLTIRVRVERLYGAGTWREATEDEPAG